MISSPTWARLNFRTSSTPYGSFGEATTAGVCGLAVVLLWEGAASAGAELVSAAEAIVKGMQASAATTAVRYAKGAIVFIIQLQHCRSSFLNYSILVAVPFMVKGRTAI